MEDHDDQWESNLGSLTLGLVDLDPGTAQYLRPHGLAWSPDGSRLFALTGQYGVALSLHVIRH